MDRNHRSVGPRLYQLRRCTRPDHSPYLRGILHDRTSSSPGRSVERPNNSWIRLGVIATWWVGVLLGIPLATVSRIGSRPKRTVRSLTRPIAVLLGGNAILAVVAGFAGYIAASNGWVRLVGPIADKVPHEKHIPFLVDLWAHNGSYLGAFVGGIILMNRVWRSRGESSRISNT